MVLNNKTTCTVTESLFVTSDVVRIRFEPKKKIKFEAGQFLSVVLPVKDLRGKHIRRAYSFASSHELSKENGYELCIKVLEGGLGSNYMASLKVGDTFEVHGPYGDFLYQPHENQTVCFISTGTGIAPLKAIAESKKFQNDPPDHSILLFGARTEKDILYPGCFEKLGFEVVYAVSRPTQEQGNFFNGRVTDFLETVPPEWPWENVDYYICGNGSMIEEVEKFLLGKSVKKDHIHKEAYFKVIPKEKKKAA